MIGKPFSGVLSLLLLTLPSITNAGALWEGVGCDGPTCSSCNVVALANNVIAWIIGFALFIFVIIFVLSGFRLVASRGNPEAVSYAKSRFVNAVIGLLIIIAGWTAVDTLVKILVSDTGNVDGVYWAEVQCYSQAAVAPMNEEFDYVDGVGPRLTATGDNAAELNTTDIAARIAAIENTGDVTELANAALDAAGITDPEQRRYFRALISQESGNCSNKVGPDTGKGRGRAYGCVQTLVSTARQLDSQNGENRFAGQSDAIVAATMRDDNAYNMYLGAIYYKQGIEKYGNINSALARYNGGDGALKPSSTCPGQTYYECTANKGYAETRNYVSNINKIAQGLE